MAGGTRMGIGGALENFIQTYLAVNNQNLNRQRQSRLDAQDAEQQAFNQDRTLGQDALNRPIQEAQGTIATLNAADHPKALASQRVKEATDRFGVKAFEFPQVQADLKLLGQDSTEAPLSVKAQDAKDEQVVDTANLLKNVTNDGGAALENTPQGRAKLDLLHINSNNVFPRPINVAPGGTVLDPTTREPIFKAPDRPRDPILNELAQARLDEVRAKQGVGGTNGALGEDALKGLSPQDAEMVKRVANYDIPVTGAAMRSPQFIRWTQLAAAYDPTFDVKEYATKQAVRKDFTSGKAAINVRSLNTLIGHIDTLRTKAAALKNGQYPLVNSAMNLGKQQGGKGPITGFKNAAIAVEDEAASLFKGTGATDQQIKQWAQGFSPDMSPEQQKESFATLLELVSSRMQALENQYSTGMAKPRDFAILNPKSRAVLKSFGIEPSQWDPIEGPPPAAGKSDRAVVPPSSTTGGQSALDILNARRSQVPK